MRRNKKKERENIALNTLQSHYVQCSEASLTLENCDNNHKAKIIIRLSNIVL